MMINEYGAVARVFRHYIGTDYFYLETWVWTDEASQISAPWIFGKKIKIIK
jgi:hypothetical protein